MHAVLTPFLYTWGPRPIGFNATISAPHMHAHALEDLEEFIRPGMKVLDVGCGSGYREHLLVYFRQRNARSAYPPFSVTAVIHHMVCPPGGEKNGLVVGIDHLPGLTELSKRNLKSDGIEVGEGKGIEIVTGDGRKGMPCSDACIRLVADVCRHKDGNPEVNLLRRTVMALA